MRFATGVFALAAVISAVFAQENPISKPTAGDTITAGKPFTIVWQPTTSGTITLTLRKGASTDLKTLETITADATNSGSFDWTPSSDLVSGENYAIMITDSAGDVNYTPQFGVSSNVKASETMSLEDYSTTSASATESTSHKATSTISASASTTEKSSSHSHSLTDKVITATATHNATSTEHHHPTITSTKGHHNSSSIFTTSITTGRHNSTSIKSNHTHSATSTKSKSGSATKSSASPTGPTGTAPVSAANTILRSPIALVMCVIGAIMYLN